MFWLNHQNGQKSSKKEQRNPQVMGCKTWPIPGSHLSYEKMAPNGCLGDQLYRDYFINHSKASLLSNQDSMESKGLRVFFVAHFSSQGK